MIGKVYENNPFMAMENYWYPLSTNYIKRACANTNVTQLWESYITDPVNDEQLSEFMDPQITITLAALRGAKSGFSYFPEAVMQKTDTGDLLPATEINADYNFVDSVGLSAFEGDLFIVNDVCGSVLVDDNYDFKRDNVKGWYSVCATNLFPYIDTRNKLQCQPEQGKPINEYSVAVGEHNFFFCSDDASIFLSRVGKRRLNNKDVEYLALPTDTTLFVHKLPDKNRSLRKAKLYTSGADGTKKINIKDGAAKSSSFNHSQQSGGASKQYYGLYLPASSLTSAIATPGDEMSYSEFNLNEDFNTLHDKHSPRAITFKTETLFKRVVTNEDIIFLSAVNRYTEVSLALISMNIVKFPNTVKDSLLKTAYANATLFGSSRQDTDVRGAQEWYIILLLEH